MVGIPFSEKPLEKIEISQSRKISLLIDEQEMEHLFASLPPFEMWDVCRPVSLEEAQISTHTFLIQYEKYVRGIRGGMLVEENFLRPFFSCVMTRPGKGVYAQVLKNEKYLIRSLEPVIQLQRHHFIYSDTFHSGVMGKESITWGISFSYPQLYLDPKTKEIGKVERNPLFSNTALFQSFTQWARNYTQPTPFWVEGKKINQPYRLGKRCFSWINHHPSLKQKGMYVANGAHSQKAVGN